MDNQIMTEILNLIDEGIIYLDPEDRVEFFNEKAKEITGVSLKSSRFHPDGRLEEGDLVVIATNKFGVDDGPLTVESLKAIGCSFKSLEREDALIAVGIYGGKEIKGEYKKQEKSEISDVIAMKVRFLGNEIDCEINQSSKYIKIQINGDEFKQSYVKAFGHMVVMDGKTGRIKFFQDKGYTIRNESAFELLNGKAFRGKGVGNGEFKVVGVNIRNIFDSDQLYEKLSEIKNEASFGRSSSNISNTFFTEINHRPISYNIAAVYKAAAVKAPGTAVEPDILGVLIRFRDLSEINNLLNERNQMLESLERFHEFIKFPEEQAQIDGFDAFIGNSMGIKNVKYLAARASEIRSNVLITGASGTGKTYLARLIHENSGLGGSFVEVNCAAIPQGLFESELFGYESGAFTGASQKGKDGYFARAQNGTLFLDEIGELPVEFQVKLLQVLQSKEFYRVGASSPTKVDVRIITATNRSLAEAVEQNKFREDLYYRINVFPIHMPSLSERREDLYLIINDMLKNISSKMNMPSKQISGEAFNRLLNHSWNGNLRELENVIERAMAICRGDIIYSEHISMLGRGSRLSDDGIMLKDKLDAYEKQVLIETLEATESSKIAMQLLGLSKSTFYEKLKKHGIKGF